MKVFVAATLTLILGIFVRAEGGFNEDRYLTHAIPTCAKNIIPGVYAHYDCTHDLCICTNNVAVAEIASLSRHSCLKDEFFGIIRYLEAICGNMDIHWPNINLRPDDVDVVAAPVRASKNHHTKRNPAPIAYEVTPYNGTNTEILGQTKSHSLEDNMWLVIIVPVLVAILGITCLVSYFNTRHLPRRRPIPPPPPSGSHEITRTAYLMPDTVERDQFESMAGSSLDFKLEGRDIEAAGSSCSSVSASKTSVSDEYLATGMIGEASSKESLLNSSQTGDNSDATKAKDAPGH